MPSRTQRRGVALPGHGLAGVGLAEGLEQPHGGAVPVERVHVVDDHRLVAELPEPAVDAQGRRVALDPAGISEDLPGQVALLQAGCADEDEQVE